jgi:chorismate mutase
MANLKELRREIDEVDEQIIRCLADRVKVCQAIGAAKKAQGLPVKDAVRERDVYQLVRKQATNLGLDPVQVEAVYREIVNMCSSVQE